MVTQKWRCLVLSAAMAAVVGFDNSVLAADLFVADYGGGGIGLGGIYRCTPDGIRSTFATGLNGPWGLAFNSAGDLFESDAGSGTICKFTPSGTQSVFASGLNHPRGLAFDANGDLFVGDFVSDDLLSGGVIYRFTSSGTQSVFASGIEIPQYLAFNGNGNLFTSNEWGDISKFTPNGDESTFVPWVEGRVVIEGLAFDGSGNLFAATWSDATGNGNICKYTPDGVQSLFATTDTARGLTFDASGSLFEADQGSAKIYEFTPNGARSTFATGITWPMALAFAPIPEPSCFALLLTATLGGLLWWRRRS